jgi:septum formation protein
MKLYLASRSPRRQELLRQIGVEFELLAADVPEHPQGGERPMDYVSRLADEKAQAARARMEREGLPARPILAADTTVVADELVLGKPRDQADAARMLASLAGRTHEVLTAVTLLDGLASRRALSISQVTFGPISPQDAARYWSSGEPADKAGGYAIQGRAAAFIAHMEGSYSGVVGLPLYEVAQMLRDIGCTLP